MELRPYQTDAIDAVLSSLADNPILVAPTGSGKTVMGTEIVRRHGGRVLWLAHRRELIQQAARQLEAFGLSCGVIQAGVTPCYARPVQVASIQTLARRAHPEADLVVLDEAHHCRAATYRKVFDAYPGVPRLGLTATPFRLDGRGLGDVFGKIIVAATAKQLCDDGTLVAPIVYAPPADPLKGVRIVAGEFNMEQAARRLDQPKLVANIVDTWLKHARGRRTLCFTINVLHSKHLVERFVAAGVAAEHLDGTADALTRRLVQDRLRDGVTLVVSTCMIWTEGIDIPALEVAIVARPTASLNLHLQMLGRIMRACDGKGGAVVLDHAGNYNRHGEVTRDIAYSLDDDAKPVIAPPSGKACPKCYLICDRWDAECPECGYVFGSDKKETPVPKEAEGELERVGENVPLAIRQAYYDHCEAQRIANCYKDGYSAAKYHAKFGIWPLAQDGTIVDTVAAGANVKNNEYRKLMEVARRKNYRPGWAAYMFKARFGHWPQRGTGG